MTELNKKTCKEVKRLVAEAYAKEFDQHLLELSERFDDWKNRKITGDELGDDIHKFHDGISRELYNLYNSRMDIMMIARGVSKDLLRKEELPSEIIETVEQCIIGFFTG